MKAIPQPLVSYAAYKMVPMTPTLPPVLFNYGLHRLSDINAEAGCSKTRQLSELSADSCMNDDDTDLDSCMTDTTLVEDASDDNEDDADFVTCRKRKARALSLDGSVKPKAKPAAATGSARHRDQLSLKRGPRDASGICEVTFPVLDCALEKSVSFVDLPRPSIPDMKSDKALPPLVRPKPDHNLPSLYYIIDRGVKPMQTVLDAVALRRVAVDRVEEAMKRVQTEQEGQALHDSCLACRKEGLQCTTKQMRQRHLPCVACVNSGIPCLWAAEGDEGEKKLPVDVSDSEEVVQRPPKRQRVASSTGSNQHNRNRPRARRLEKYTRR